MITWVVLVAVALTIPLMAWATRRKAPAGVRWSGIDWSPERKVAAFDRALAREPDRADALLGRARARQELGDADGALADYARAFALGAETSASRNDRGCLLRERGDLHGALADARRAVELAPEDPVPRVSLAEALAALGQLDDALEALREAVRRDAAWGAHARTSPALAALRAARGDDPLFAA